MSLDRDPNGRYAIQGPDAERPWVEFWAARRLSFDNKPGWQKQLISDLARRLQVLPSITARAPHPWLRAVFASDDPIDCDAGNMTYLNVGTRPFAELADRIAFERWHEVPEAPCQIASESGYRYYHRYSLDSSQEPERWRIARRLASWENVPCGSLTGDHAARYVWLAMRRRPERIILELDGDPWAGVYGVNIRVGCPGTKLPAPAGMLEAVVDGCLASFHRDEDEQHATQVVAKLSTQLRDTNEHELLSALTGAGPTLFARPPFKRYPTFVQLSPCDERCLVGSLDVRREGGRRLHALGGEIFALERSG